jgi:predicted nucleic acid-binding protein
MDSFLDTTVIIKYLEYDYIKEQLTKKCFEHVKSSDSRIIISFIVKDETNRAILKRKEIYEYILKKIKEPDYELDSKKAIYLNKQDIIHSRELYLKFKEKDFNRLKQDFNDEINFLNASFDLFLRKRIDEISITKSELDKFLLSIIHNFIEDFADCRVLTSAMQIQQDKNTFFFVTADDHFNPNTYKFIEEQFKIDYQKENYKFPTLKNFLYEI